LQSVSEQGGYIHSCLGSGGQNYASCQAFANRESCYFWLIRLTLYSHPSCGLHAAVPAHVSRWQMTYVAEGRSAYYAIPPIAMGHHPARFHRDIGPLNNLGVAS